MRGPAGRYSSANGAIVNGTIHIVDDDASFRRAIVRLLRMNGYEVVEHDSADQLLANINEAKVDCILLDIEMPGLSGPELQRRLVEGGSAPPIIFLTGHADVVIAVKAVKAGAEDVLIKPVSGDVLLASIEEALVRGEIRNEEMQWILAAQARVGTLTAREHEVFIEVAHGQMNKQIAYRFGISERTIKAHRQRVFEKLEVGTLAELVTLADHLGLVDKSRGKGRMSSGRIPSAQI